jgi:glycerophosphoryl diester phosphodiesterase
LSECVNLRIGRAEVDLQGLHDRDFLVFHDSHLERASNGAGPVAGLTRVDAQGIRLRWKGRSTGEPVPLFSDMAALLAEADSPTVVELDLQDIKPLPWPQVELLAELVQPIKSRVILNGTDWNLRRLLAVDATLPVSVDVWLYLDAVAESFAEFGGIDLRRGAYGYFDNHVLASERTSSVRDYLVDRLGGLLGLVPGALEVHVRLELFEKMLADGIRDAVDLFHRQGLRVDVWTLNADMPEWASRLATVVDAGIDIITTDTPGALLDQAAAIEHLSPLRARR